MPKQMAWGWVARGKWDIFYFAGTRLLPAVVQQMEREPRWVPTCHYTVALLTACLEMSSIRSEFCGFEVPNPDFIENGVPNYKTKTREKHEIRAQKSNTRTS